MGTQVIPGLFLHDARLEGLTHILRWSFNLTLFITALFAIAGGASSNAVALCAFVTVWSIGVGGNLPVDSAVFLGRSTG